MRKMEINALFGVVLALVLIGVLLGLGLTILSQMEPSTTGQASQAINETVTGIRTIPRDWLGIIIIVIVASIVLVLLIRNLGGAAGGSR
jgi:type II secretory pathway component PulF